MWSAYYKLPGWVDVIFDLAIKQVIVLWEFSFNAWNNYINNILFNLRKHCFISREIIMLCRNNNGVYAYRLVIIIILKRNLAFSIRAKVFDLLVLASNCSKFNEDVMCKV